MTNGNEYYLLCIVVMMNVIYVRRIITTDVFFKSHGGVTVQYIGPHVCRSSEAKTFEILFCCLFVCIQCGRPCRVICCTQDTTLFHNISQYI